jgi:hypothetical protein
MPLHRLIYSSYAVPNFNYQDLKAIMEVSNKNNRLAGITGILSYCDSMFLQILEGNCEVISRTYHRIATDKRHHTPTLIECIPIESRIFGNWSMHMIRLIDLNPDTLKRLILQYSDTTSFKPNLMTPYQCLEFSKRIAKLQLSNQKSPEES